MDLSRLFRKRHEDAAPAAAPTTGESPPQEAPAPQPANSRNIEEAVIEVLRTVYDPEIPVNIYELGLVYNIDVDASGKLVVRMTLTSPGCPVAGSLIPEIEGKVRQIPGVTDVVVQLVWDPPWDPGKMSDAAKLQLGMF